MANKKTPKPAAVRGRPTGYSNDIADKICELVSNGSNLNKIGKMKQFPARSTIMIWISEQTYFSDSYTRARENRADWRVDRMDDVTQDLRDGTIDHQTARIEHDAIKWQAGKEKSKSYGDKLDVEHGGNITVNILDGLGRTDDK